MNIPCCEGVDRFSVLKLYCKHIFFAHKCWSLMGEISLFEIMWNTSVSSNYTCHLCLPVFKISCKPQTSIPIIQDDMALYIKEVASLHKVHNNSFRFGQVRALRRTFWSRWIIRDAVLGLSSIVYIKIPRVTLPICMPWAQEKYFNPEAGPFGPNKLFELQAPLIQHQGLIYSNVLPYMKGSLTLLSK